MKIEHKEILYLLTYLIIQTIFGLADIVRGKCFKKNAKSLVIDSPPYKLGQILEIVFTILNASKWPTHVLCIVENDFGSY